MHRKSRLLEKLKAIDWCFTDFQSSTGLFHIGEVNNIHWYPGRCIPVLPSTLLSLLSRPGQVLLDPFIGSGTMAAAAIQCGLVPIGIDINPVACLMSQVKISLVPPETLHAFAGTITRSIRNAERRYNLNKGNDSQVTIPSIPNFEENSLWYHPKTLRQLGVINRYINTIEVTKLKAIAFVCFSSILRACCSQQNHWGYVCDNMRPKLLIEKNAFNIYIKRLQQYVAVLEGFYHHVASSRNKRELRLIQNASRIINASATTIAQYIEDGSVDIIITSPPYPGVNDYVNSQRLTLLWLKDGKYLYKISRENEIGARWKRFRKGTINHFIAEMSQTLPPLSRSLKRHGYFCLIYGESATRPSAINALTSKIESCGFEHLAAIGRNIAKKRALIPKVMNETIHIFQKL